MLVKNSEYIGISKYFLPLLMSLNKKGVLTQRAMHIVLRRLCLLLLATAISPVAY
jgi:hypothetical protein